MKKRDAPEDSKAANTNRTQPDALGRGDDADDDDDEFDERDEDMRPIIIIDGDVSRVVDEALAALARHPHVRVHNGKLVRLWPRRADDGTSVGPIDMRELDAMGVREVLSQCARFQKVKGGGIAFSLTDGRTLLARPLFPGVRSTADDVADGRAITATIEEHQFVDAVRLLRSGLGARRFTSAEIVEIFTRGTVRKTWQLPDADTAKGRKLRALGQSILDETTGDRHHPPGTQEVGTFLNKLIGKRDPETKKASRAVVGAMGKRYVLSVRPKGSRRSVFSARVIKAEASKASRGSVNDVKDADAADEADGDE